MVGSGRCHIQTFAPGRPKVRSGAILTFAIGATWPATRTLKLGGLFDHAGFKPLVGDRAPDGKRLIVRPDPALFAA